jgi:hypothetical protein
MASRLGLQGGGAIQIAIDHLDGIPIRKQSVRCNVPVDVCNRTGVATTGGIGVIILKV